MDRLMKAGWYLEGQIIKQDHTDYAGPRGTVRTISSTLSVTRPGLPTAYCLIPLKIMAQFLMKDGVVLINDYQDKIAKISENDTLRMIDDKIMAEYSRATTPEYWLERNDPWLKDARNRFFHFSAHYNSTGMGPRFKDGQRKRKQYDG